jgi:DNA-binding MarR family transcriptional regulator
MSPIHSVTLTAPRPSETRHNEPETTRSELDRKFIAAIERLGRARRVARQAVATEFHISLLQLQIVEHLDTLSSRRLGLLAAELDVTQPTISDAISALYDKGIAERKADSDDGRATQATLTATGSELAARATATLAPKLHDERVDSDQDQATALKVVLNEIRRMQLAGVISINRSCLSYSHCQPPVASVPGRCLLLRTELTPADLRVDCADHHLAP